MISIVIEKNGVNLKIKDEGPADVAVGAVHAVQAIAVSIERNTDGRISAEESMKEIAKAIIRSTKTVSEATVFDMNEFIKQNSERQGKE